MLKTPGTSALLILCTTLNVQATCLGDLNDDGRRDFEDLAILKDNFFCQGECVGDLNGDGTVNFLDFQIFEPLMFSDCPPATVITYQYDALDRLVHVGNPIAGDRDYQYDDAGNREWVTTENSTPIPATPGRPYLTGVNGCPQAGIDVDGNYTVHWNSVHGAGNYLLQRDLDPPFQVSGLSHPESQEDGDYSYRVKACNGSGCSSYSLERTVEVFSECDIGEE